MCLSVCLCVCVCPQSYFRNYAVRSSPILLHVTHGRGSVLLWRRSDRLRISGFMDDVIFAHKPRLLDVAARLRQRGSHAALGLARRNTRCRQRTLGATSCSQGLLGRKWRHRERSLRSMSALLRYDAIRDAILTCSRKPT